MTMTETLIVKQPPTSNPIGGHLPQFRKDPLAFFEKAATYGDMVSLRFGPVKGYLLTNPELIQQVLVQDANKYGKSRMLRLSTSRTLGNGLLTSEGDFHHKQRKMIQPAFHHKRIFSYGDDMVTYTEAVLANWKKERFIAVDREMTDLTMRIVAKVLFGVEDLQEADMLGRAIAEGVGNVGKDIRRGVPLPGWLSTPNNLSRRKSAKMVIELIDEIIVKRREENIDKGDLLSMLLLSVDGDGNSMSSQQVRDEAVTLFIAGHETTANLLTWTLYLLARHSDVFQRLKEEVRTQLLSAEKLPEMPYIEMVLKEVMRLYPPAWIFGRMAKEPTELGGERLEAGTAIFISPWAMGRNPRYFCDPLRFAPERFAPEQETRIPKYAYLPFGGGPRVCIGNGFAMMEAQLVLGTILQHIEKLELMAGQDIQPDPVVMLRPAKAVEMYITPAY